MSKCHPKTTMILVPKMYLFGTQVEGESLGIDTGMVDGEGQSRYWKPYWKHCGICHPLFQPHFILHMDHMEEDKKVKAWTRGLYYKRVPFMEKEKI